MRYDHLSLEQKVLMAEGCQGCEDMFAKHAIMHAAGQTEEELDTMWVAGEDDLFWSHNFGCMTNRAGVYKGWAGGLARNADYYYEQLKEVYPEVIGMDPRALMECAVHMLASGIIEAAEDGRTVRASWYTPGIIFSTLNPEQAREGAWIWERYGIDFMLEDGQWKIYHQHVCQDLVKQFDYENWAQAEYRLLTEPQKPRGHVFPPYVDIPGPAYFKYTPVQPVQNTVPWPEPYRTLDEHHTYAKPVCE